MRKKRMGIMLIFSCIILVGCSPTNRSIQEIPEALYTEAGYAVKSEINTNGTIKITYALVGLKKDKIEYLYLDQIEQNPSKERFLFTNKEMRTAYGLSYKSDHGEWFEQVEALENYITGKQMTIDEVNEISTYKKDGENLKVPKKGTDLEAACELDLTDFLDVINEACSNTKEIEATRLGVGEDIRVSNSENKIDVTLGFIATDYRFKICYSFFDKYSINGQPGSDVRSFREKASEEKELEQWERGLEGYESYIEGLNMIEAYSVETFDPGNGIEMALPKSGTDLANVCDIDLYYIIKVMQEIGGRL